MRLAKHLAHAGVASRRAAEQLVFAGRVSVDGEVVTDPARDISGRRARRGRRRAGRLGAGGARRLRPQQAGRRRLDRERHARAPDRRRPRTRAGRPAALPGRAARRRHERPDPADRRRRPRQPPHAPALRGAQDLRRARRRPARAATARCGALRDGVELEDGPTAPAQVGRLGPHELELTLHEGRKRQVRRMCEAVGLRSARCERISFGPLALGRLPEGRRAGCARRGRAAAAGGCDTSAEATVASTARLPRVALRPVA